MKYNLIIAAGGIGTRLSAALDGQKKQFFYLNNKTILEYSIDKFYKFLDITKTIISVPFDTDENFRRNLEEKYKNLKVIDGGKTRQDSIFNAIKCLSLDDDDIVIIHDAVRPFFTKDSIDRLIANVNKFGASVLGVKANDTIRMTDIDGKSIETLDRTKLWQVQTPQAFLYKIIFSAYKKAYEDNFVGTDDASLVERIGEPVYMVEGDYKNFKITTPFDIEMAKYYIEERGILE